VSQHSAYVNFRFKSLLDRLASALCIVLLSPLLIAIVVLIRITSPGPIFFRQERVGKDLALFELYKFRTMTVDTNRQISQTNLTDPDVTAMGKWLRRFKLDELPQLVNVLAGHMSFVGPRPCLPFLIDLLDDIGKRRFLVKPGLTGLAQVNGNIYIDVKKRVELDVQYVESVSLYKDFSIILKTVLVVVLGEHRFAS